MESNKKRKRKETNEFIYKIETYLQMSKTNLQLPKGKCGGGGGGAGEQDKSGAGYECTHPTLYKIHNQHGPLCSTGNSTQYSVITYMRKESKKE